MSNFEKKFKTYYLTAIFSLIFAVVGFSYNAWRMEVTEDNSNIRTAAFEVLTELAELEQLIYSAHYDHDVVAGNPRMGWVKIGLVVDLSSLISDRVEAKAEQLKKTWSNNWESIQRSQKSTDKLIEDIDSVRFTIKEILKSLE